MSIVFVTGVGSVCRCVFWSFDLTDSYGELKKKTKQRENLFELFGKQNQISRQNNKKKGFNKDFRDGERYLTDADRSSSSWSIDLSKNRLHPFLVVNERDRIDGHKFLFHVCIFLFKGLWSILFLFKSFDFWKKRKSDLNFKKKWKKKNTHRKNC